MFCFILFCFASKNKQQESQSFSYEINASTYKQNCNPLQYFFSPRSKLLIQYSVSSVPTLYIHNASMPKLLGSTTFMKSQELANQLANLLKADPLIWGLLN